MPEDLRQLVKEHHAFYEVLPFYIDIEEKHGSPEANRRRIQAGYDVDIYGAQTNGDFAPLSRDYAEAYSGLREIAQTISHQANDSCALEVIQFPSTIILDTRNYLQALATLRMRISHCRGVEQSAGVPEERALAELEKQLHILGLVRR